MRFALLLVPFAAHAQLDPSVIDATITALDGTPLGGVQFVATAPTPDFVGYELWSWNDTAWPDEAFVLAADSVQVTDAVVYHQATFPEDAWLQQAPKGDITYAIADVGWLVVDGDKLTWLLAPEAEVDLLIPVDKTGLVFKPIDSVEADGPFRAIVQTPL